MASLNELRGVDGSFLVTTLECLGAAETTTSMTVADTPSAGEADWFLLRAVNCGGASTYNSAGSSQANDRDPQVAAKPEACP